MILHEERLDGVHPDLVLMSRRVAFTAHQHGVDVLVVCGRRNKAEQDVALAAGTSQKAYPSSRHNPDHPDCLAAKAIMAVDLALAPLDYGNAARFGLLAGLMFQEESLSPSTGHKLVWGGDWNGNLNAKDEKFYDGPHFELRKA